MKFESPSLALHRALSKYLLLDFPANIKINLNTFRNVEIFYVNTFSADKTYELFRVE